MTSASSYIDREERNVYLGANNTTGGFTWNPHDTRSWSEQVQAWIARQKAIKALYEEGLKKALREQQQQLEEAAAAADPPREQEGTG